MSEAASPSETEPAKKRRRRRWIPLVLGAVLLVAAAPTVVSLTPLKDLVLGSAIPSGAGSLTARGASVHWFGSPALTGVEMRDPQGELLFSAEELSVGSSLVGLVTNPSGPLNVRLANPVFNVVVQGQESNVERMLAAMQSSDTDPNPQEEAADGDSSTRLISAEVSGGKVQLTDAATGERWLLSGLELSAQKIGGPATEIDFSAEGLLAAIAADGSPVSGGAISLRMGDAEDGRRLARATVEKAPLSVAGVALRRNDPTARVSGEAQLQGQAAWRRGALGADPIETLFAEGFSSSGALVATNVTYTGRATGGEPLRVDSIDSPWKIASSGDRIAIQEWRASSRFGSVQGVGSITRDEATAWLNGATAPPRDLKLNGELDIAQFAAVAPNVLRLQQGVRIDSGSVRGEVTCSADERGPVVSGGLFTDRLTGQSGAGPISWDNPLEVRFTARQIGQRWGVEDLRCDSEFATVRASGDANQARGSANFDLDQLAAELSQFVNLGGVRLAGNGSANFRWGRTDGDGGWSVGGDGQMTDLFVGQAQNPIAREPKVEFNGVVRKLARDPNPISSADITLTAGADKLIINAQESPGPSQPFTLELSGDLASWLRRARLAVPGMPGSNAFSAGGQIAASATGELENNVFRIEQFQSTLTSLAVDTPGGLRVREPRISMSGDATWNAQTGVAISEQAQLVGATVSLRARQLSVTPGGPPESTRGEVVFRVDPTRLSTWFATGQAQPAWTAQGQVTGGVVFVGIDQGVRISGNVSGKQLALLSNEPTGQRVVWSEPSIEAALRAAITSGESGPSTLALEQLQVNSNMLTASATGGVQDLGRLAGVDLGGALQYDLERISPLLWPRLGDGFKLYGKEQASFRIQSDDLSGATGLEALTARVDVPWEGADLFGLPIGAGSLGATLQKGTIKVDPLAISIGEGRLNAAPQVTLTPPPSALQLAPGPLITDVAISQQVAERILKFIAPVLADATRIDGEFSMALREFATPLGNTGQTRASGQLAIHSAQVLPGPAVAEWVALARQVRGVVRDGVEGVAQSNASPLLTVTDQTIPFQLADGRVYHQGFNFDVGDVRVISEGSVGTDETLDLLLTIPILDEWVERRPVILGGLRGQAIRFPVRGTFSRPQLDREAFRELSRQLLESAAEGAINTGINLLLERLNSR